MPLYYFHLHNRIESRDEEGTMLDDLPAARAAAIHSVRRLMAEDIVERGEVTLSHRIEIENEHGQQVLIVRFGDGVTVRP